MKPWNLRGILAVCLAIGAIQAGEAASNIATTGDCSPIVRDTQGNVEINISCPIQLSPVQLRELIESLRTPEGPSADLISEFRDLSAQFGVTETALKNFFKILDTENVFTWALDNTLREVAQRHLELLNEVQRVRSDDPEVQALRDRASAAIEAVDYDRAENLLERVEEADLVVARRAQEEAEPRFLSAAETRAQRGQVQLAQLHYTEAVGHFQAAADLVPSDHSLVRAGYLSRAGNAWYNAGSYAKAEPLLKRALKINKAVLGPDHPNVGIRLNNLAEIYSAQGRYARAKRFYERALAIMEGGLGPSHPTTVTVKRNLYDLKAAMADESGLSSPVVTGTRGGVQINIGIGSEYPDLRQRRVGPESGDEELTTVVQVFYGTDRRDNARQTVPDFGSQRGRKLSLGQVFVSVPTVHTIGMVERPWSYTVLGITFGADEDPAEHFVIQRNDKLDREEFVAALRKVVDASQSFQHQALVFIHGYNVSFDAAAYRTAQLAYDLQFDGAPIFYSWPSRGSVGHYEYDQNSARQARPFLKDFLEMVPAESGAEVIHLVAHSMGNNPLMEVLAELNAARDEQAPLFNQVILAAPDIDVDVFIQLAEKVRGVAQGITLYASAADRALEAAKTYAGGVPRAGDVPSSGPLIVPDIDTIDITVVGTDLLSLNHSEYAENRFLLQDIGLLFKTGLRPPDARNTTLHRIELMDRKYWVFPH